MITNGWLKLSCRRKILSHVTDCDPIIIKASNEQQHLIVFNYEYHMLMIYF
jgi:hypothetical protein